MSFLCQLAVVQCTKILSQSAMKKRLWHKTVIIITRKNPSISLPRLAVGSLKISKGRNYMFIRISWKKPVLLSSLALFYLWDALTANLCWIIPKAWMNVKHCFSCTPSCPYFQCMQLEEKISPSPKLCWKVIRHWGHKSRQDEIY